MLCVHCALERSYTQPITKRRWALGSYTTLTPGFLQIDVGHGRKAIVIFVPVPLLPGWHKSQQR